MGRYFPRFSRQRDRVVVASEAVKVGSETARESLKLRETVRVLERLRVQFNGRKRGVAARAAAGLLLAGDIVGRRIGPRKEPSVTGGRGTPSPPYS